MKTIERWVKLGGNPKVEMIEPGEIKVEPGATLDHLMTLDQYEKQIASEEH